MVRNLNRPAAARFSFLMSIPIMLAAGLVASLDFSQMPNMGSELLVFIPGFITAAITGYLSIRWLLGYLSHRSLYVFSIYCTVMALVTILVYLVR
jgi:undecaprenyl-diphosphatase